MEHCRKMSATIERRLSWAPCVGVVAILAAALSLAWWFTRDVRTTPIARLVRAASKERRTVQPRLSGGFPPAPFGNAQRGENDLVLEQPRLVAAVADVLSSPERMQSPEREHVTGLAYLLIGKEHEAVRALETASNATSNGTVWSDLAAARYVEAVDTDDPSKLVGALVAADVAIEHSPRLTEARFNRALILERFGLRDQAREAWETYLKVDIAGPWAEEAREHARSLAPIALFKDELTKDYERLTRDAIAARELARRYPLEARTWGETEILGRWALAENAGSVGEAAKHLALARHMAEQLTSTGGDRMLQSLVRSVDNADASNRRELASAHVAFREGQKLFRSGRPADAERELTKAAESFRRGGSPGELLARYFAANAAYTQGRIDDAYDRLRALLDAPPDFAAHRAQVLWQVGLVHLARGRLDESIAALSESVNTFARLGEMFYAAAVREILAEDYDRIGDADSAWRHRLICLRDLGARITDRLQIALASMSRAAALNRDWRAAVSFLNLEIDVSDRIDDAPQRAAALILRARVRLRRGDNSGSLADIAGARATMDRVSDAGYRDFLDANASAVEALNAQPPHSVALLTKAIEFHRTKGRRIYLASLYLDRGRAYRDLGDDTRAAADFEFGIRELESQRESLSAGEKRWGAFQSGEELFEEAVILELEREDPASAFAYVERARARSLLDALGSSWKPLNPNKLRSDTAIIEYVVFDATMVIFVVKRDGIRAVQQPADRTLLDVDAEALSADVSSRDPARFRQRARAMYTQLLAPIETEIAGISNVVIVPDPTLSAIPFAALLDTRGNHFVEQHSIAIAPSAATYAHVSDAGPVRTGSILIVRGSEELGPLSAAAREVKAVAGLYSQVTQLAGEEATAAAFAAAAASADVIYFIGHGVSSGGGRRNGFLLLAKELDVRQISAMRFRRTSLVVLAACATAAGETRSTEGTISVARAFLAAGVPSVVATLWRIDDGEAASFFPIVHQHLARGLTLADAVRAAQLDSIRNGITSHRTWAAIQVIGR
jgi:CHAT domain-containing protein